MVQGDPGTFAHALIMLLLLARQPHTSIAVLKGTTAVADSKSLLHLPQPCSVSLVRSPDIFHNPKQPC